MQLNPSRMTVGDLIAQAMKECGRVGIGQQPSSEETQDGLFRLQTMLQEWERKRWLVYHLIEYSITSTGKLFYTIGPQGDIDTGKIVMNASGGDFGQDFGPDFNNAIPQNKFGGPRPDRLEYAFLRQLTQSQPNQIDYPLTLIEAREDYSRIALKTLQSFPDSCFYNPAWPLGEIYAWPVPQAAIYAIHVGVKEQLPAAFLNTATVVNLPFEYFNAVLYNLAFRLRSRYGIPSFQGDMLPGLAKDALAAVRGANTAIASLTLPNTLIRPEIYNIFSDRTY